ncbi:protein MARD1 [Iris pallida]|uniref:Protein MARD1 n=1 Tax=Iris pallida TaxID=29817 RepID=A0AAX6DJZ3_IRIPA|nr:protein MARD1 [Iris pallida]
MLKKRTKPVSSGGTKQSLMSEKYSLSSPKPPNSTIFPSPRIFVGVGFSPKGFADGSADTFFAMSPTSILETTKPFSPFFADNKSQTKNPVGLGIADALKEPSRPESRMVLFGSQLKIQVPSLGAPVEPLQSPIEFGIKNKSSQLALHSPAASAARRSTVGPPAAGLVSGSLSATEMEMSEDYTCVIAHGPNPKTTHIFDNCIIESCCCCCGKGFVPAAATRKEEKGSVPAGYPSDDFLTSCDACKKSLDQGKDIFLYRGEKAFCSLECRYQEMLFDKDMVDCEPDQTAIL